MGTTTKPVSEFQSRIQRRAAAIKRRATVREAVAAVCESAPFGATMAAVGITADDYQGLTRMTGGHHSAYEVLAWMELGRPAVEMYTPCDESDVPAGVRFDTPGRNQGQIVTYSYGTTGRGEAGPGDPWMCRHDASDGEVTYYRRTWLDR